MRFPKMGHLIESVYKKACINLTRYGFSEKFFLLRSGLPQDPSRRIVCIGRFSKLLHFVKVYLKLGVYYKKYIIGVDETFHKRGENLVGLISGKDGRVHQIKQA